MLGDHEKKTKTNLTRDMGKTADLILGGLPTGWRCSFVFLASCLTSVSSTYLQQIFISSQRRQGKARGDWT